MGGGIRSGQDVLKAWALGARGTMNYYATRYHPASIALRWMVFLLAIAAFITIELKGQFPKGSESRELCKQIHEVFGQLIFIAMAIRL